MKLPLFRTLFAMALLTGCNATSTAESSTETAANTTPATESSSAQVPAIIFVQYLNQQAPTLFCQQDPGIACLNMPAELCVASVQESSERCGPKLLEAWPASFNENQENAVKYAQDYRNCLLNDWVEQYGLQPERLAACGIELK